MTFPRTPAVLCALLLTAMCCSCSASSAGSVSVLNPWTTGSDQKTFEKIIARFTQETGVAVVSKSSRASQQALQSDLAAGDPPDLAILPNAGTLGIYARQQPRVLQPLSAILRSDPRSAYRSQWLSLEKAGTNEIYAVVVKASIKSLIWYEPGYLSYRPLPQTWPQLLRLDAQLSAGGAVPWCMAMADPPNSGWPATDWIEDILLHQSGWQAYQQWATGRLSWQSPQVASAFRAWASIVGPPQQIYSGPLGAIMLNYSSADLPMTSSPRPGCYLSHGALPPPGGGADFVPFPSFGNGVQSGYEVGADLIGMFHDTPQARQLIRFLAGAEAQTIWTTGEPDQAFSPAGDIATRSAVTAIYKKYPVGGRIDQMLNSGAPLCFDASDLMPAVLENAFYSASQTYLLHPDDAHLGGLLKQLDRVTDNARAQGTMATFACST